MTHPEKSESTPGLRLRQGFATANGVRFHYAEAGHGPLVLLLHGFPEFWYGWRRQMPALAKAGFRVVAPDLRGYNLTERPAGVPQYRLPLLVEDVVQLITALGETSAGLVGHDWGGMIAWYVAMHHPRLVRRLAILNAPHPAAYRRELRRFSSQAWRSAYAAFFQLPLLPERLLRARGFALLRRALRGGPARDPEDMKRYIDALARPGALTAPPCATPIRIACGSSFRRSCSGASATPSWCRPLPTGFTSGSRISRWSGYRMQRTGCIMRSRTASMRGFAPFFK